MQQHTPPTPPFASALIVTTSADHLRTDRDFLRRAGVPAVRGGTNVRATMAWLAANPVGLVLLDADLGRTTGPRVAAMLRRRRAFDRTPIVLTSTDGAEADVLEAVASGCSGFLLRPYSQEAFARQMKLAAHGADPGAARLAALALARREAAQGRHDKARLAFEQAAPPRDEAREHYRAGCTYLAARRYEEAVREFSRAVAVNSLLAEAHVGLASAWKELGEPMRAREAMRRAAQAFALRDEMLRTRDEVARILRDNPGTENPFVDLGFALVRRGDHAAAGRAYALAEGYSASGAVRAAMARACHFTADPEAAARALACGLAQATGRRNAGAVYKAIMGDVPRRAVRDAEALPSDWTPGPMHDLWAVLKYTVKAYRRGGRLPGAAPLALDF